MFTTIDYVLLALLAIAVYFDLTQKKIPNFLTFPAVLLGLAIYSVSGGLGGLVSGLAGLGVGIALFFIPFALGGMGGGDVKLMGAIGALKGVEFILYTALFTALAGGILALGYLLFSGQLFTLLKKVYFKGAGYVFQKLYFHLRKPYFNHLTVHYSSRLEEMQLQFKRKTLPYGVAIAIGALIVMGNEALQFLPNL